MSSSHRSILLSSGLMGTQQAVRLFVGVVQAKVIAVLLGTSGTGFFSLYASLVELSQGVFSLGIQGSGVRHISSRHASEGVQAAHQEVHILRRAGLLLGVVGGLTVFALRNPISRWSLGSSQYGSAYALLAVALFASIANTTQLASAQGFRKILAMTIANIVSAVVGAISSILLVYFLRLDGIAPAFAASAVLSMIVSSIMCRFLFPGKQDRVSFAQFRKRFGALVHLGMGFAFPALAMALSMYVLRVLIANRLDVNAVGLFQASWTLTTAFVVTILQAMATDFLPRISAEVGDRVSLNRMVNEQTETVMLLAFPALLLTLVFAPNVLSLFYSHEFSAAATCARWMILSMMVRITAWPTAYLPLALGKPILTIITESIFGICLVLFSALGLRRYGLEGVGMGFFAMSLVYTILLHTVGYRLTRFTLSSRCIWIGAGMAASALGIVASLLLLSGLTALLVGAGIAGLVTALSLYYTVYLAGGVRGILNGHRKDHERGEAN